MVLPQIVREMHLETASKSLVAMRDFVIGEAATLFCQGGQLKTVMEAMALEFPNLGFEVLSYATKDLIEKVENAKEEERELATDKEEDDEKEEDDNDSEGPFKQLFQTPYEPRAKAAPQKRRGRAKARY